VTRPSGRGRLDPMPWSLQILDFVVDDGRDWDLMTWPGCLLEHGWDAGIVLGTWGYTTISGIFDHILETSRPHVRMNSCMK